MNPDQGQPLFDPTNPKKPVYINTRDSSITTPTHTAPELIKAGQAIKIGWQIRTALLVLFFIFGLLPSIENFRQKQLEETQPSTDEQGLIVSDAPAGPLQAGENFTPQAPIKSQAELDAADAERKADIASLDKALGDYYFKHGYFPTLANMNDAAWRTTHVASLSAEWLRDPDSKSFTLLAVPTPDAYSYSAIGVNRGPCNNTSQTCQAYRLTAILSNGMPYYIDSL